MFRIYVSTLNNPDPNLLMEYKCGTALQLQTYKILEGFQFKFCV
jgi:hypothetical protein